MNLRKINWQLIAWLSILTMAIAVRFNVHNASPPSPYWEETALGYDAYSILKTGKDHHGNVLPVVAFESFGDWKPSLYFYAAVPFIALFDLNVFSVRLPSLLAGVSVVVSIGLLAKRIGINQYVALGVAAISPWAIHFSRAAWEANLATALIAWGMFCALSAWDQAARRWNVILSLCAVLFLVTSLYAYHAARLTVPLLLLALIWFYKDELRRTSRRQYVRLVLPLVALTLMICLPLLRSITDPSVTHRAAETSIMSMSAEVTDSNKFRELSGNSLVSRIFYHRYVLFSGTVLENMLSHLHPGFLFLDGDSNPRHGSGFFGLMYYTDALFLVLGVIYFIRSWSREKLLLFCWLGAGILPAALATPVPHALRILIALPVFLLLVARGIEVLINCARGQNWKGVRSDLLLITSLLIVHGVQFALFWRYYLTMYPIKSAREWQYGYEQIIATLNAAKATYPEVPIVFSYYYQRPLMYYWFYSKTDPMLVQSESGTAEQDQGELLQFQNISVSRTPEADSQKSCVIVAAHPAELTITDADTVLSEVKGLQHETLWVTVLRQR